MILSMNRQKVQILASVLSCLAAVCANVKASSAQESAADKDQARTVHLQFTLSQQNRPCASDEGEFKGFTYGQFRPGMSFKKFKQVQEEKGCLNSIEKVSKGTDTKAASYSLTSPTMDLFGHVWKPVFLFADDDGVYRLVMITGKFSSKDASAVVGSLKAKNGKPEEDTGSGALVWTSEDGSTRTMAVQEKGGGLDVGIYDCNLYKQWMRSELSSASSGSAAASQIKDEDAGEIDRLTREIKSEPKASGYAERARLYGRNGMHQRAAQDYSEALKLAPDEPGLLWRRAMELMILERYKEALDDCTKTIEHADEDDLDYMQALRISSGCHEKLGQVNEMLDDFKKLRDLGDKDGAEALKRYAHDLPGKH